jgi:hypothetical protein
MKELIISLLENHSVNEENQSGTKGNVIWDSDFNIVAQEIASLQEIKLREFANFITMSDSHVNYNSLELVSMFLEFNKL